MGPDAGWRDVQTVSLIHAVIHYLPSAGLTAALAGNVIPAVQLGGLARRLDGMAARIASEARPPAPPTDAYAWLTDRRRRMF
jgi:hypothetical protein